jgi:hypothetical protein
LLLLAVGTDGTARAAFRGFLALASALADVDVTGWPLVGLLREKSGTTVRLFLDMVHSWYAVVGVWLICGG